jgi:ligand-binding SRPBCC domain-containing protein
MKLFRLERSIVLPLSIDEAWSFFSDPRNLIKITPPKMNLVPTSPLPDGMYPGLVVTYGVRIAPAVSMNWVTEITHVEAPHYFVDEQRFGPYKFWHHRHAFEPCDQGVVAKDLIHYGLYGGIFSGIVNALAVRSQLEGIFDYRTQVLTDLFGAV